MEQKVLICDDIAEILDICKLILEEAGYLVETRKHCKDLVDYVIESKPDIILLDLRMPEIPGDEAFVLLKKNSLTRHIPVIFFSAHNKVANLAAASQADGYIEKPFDIATLLDMVKQKIGTN